MKYQPSIFATPPTHHALPRLAVAILFGMSLLGYGLVDSRAAVYSIPSTVPWTDTGLDVTAGSILNITATGTVQYGPESFQVTDANGGNWDGQKFFPDAVLPNTIVVSLIGKIGGTTTIGTGTLLPEGVPGNGIGFVGTSYSEVAPVSGRLFLGFNDLIGSGIDNSGSFTVTVTVVPEPSSFALVGLGALAIVWKRRRWKMGPR